MALAVPTKGSTGLLSIDKVLEFVEEVGDSCAQIIVKSDQEPAIVSLAEDVVKAREEGRTVVEQSPKQSSGSNGVVERAVQQVEGQMRALLIAVEDGPVHPRICSISDQQANGWKGWENRR